MNWYLENASSASKKALHLLDPEVAISAHPLMSCPEEILAAQRLIEVEYVSFDGDTHTGQLVVHRNIRRSIERIFRQLLAWKFPIGSMVPISAFGWDDVASMEANNTSGFNYRFIAGQKKLSWHAWGLAVDVNPFLNPWIENGVIIPEGANYNPAAPGTVGKDSEIVRLFASHGFEWGGNWNSLKDYQHFQFPVEP